MSYPVLMVPAGDVIPIMFATYDGGTGASITLTGLAITDVEIYKDGSVTQRASDAGYTLLDTDGIDFDGITGIHGFSIDTGDNTDAGFYTVGSWFTVVVSAVTVDAQTVSFIAAMFRLMAAEASAGVVDANVASIDAGAITAAAIATDAIDDDAIATGAIASTAFAAGAINAAAIATGAIDADALAADAVAEIADGVWDEDATGHQTTGTFGQAIGDPGADTTTIYQSVVTDAAGTNIAADIAAIEAQTDDIGAAGAGLTAIPWNAAWDAEVQSEVNDGLVAYDAATGTDVTAVETDTQDIQARLPAALTGGGNIKADVLAISGDTTAADRLEALMDGLIVAQVNDLSATTTAFIADGFTEATNDHFNGRLITFLTGALVGQQTDITDYVGATQTFTVTALTEAPANDDFFVVH